MTKLNIASLAVAATGFLHLKGPDQNLLYLDDDGDRKKVGITFYSPGSPQYAAADADRQNRAQDRYRDKGTTHLTSGERAEDNADFLAKITVRFENFDYDKASGATGYDFYRAVYDDISLGWILPQADKFLSSWGNFTKGSAQS